MLLNKSMGPTSNANHTTMATKPSHHSKKLINKSFENLGAGGGFKLKQSSNCDGSLLVDLKLQLNSTKSTSKGGAHSRLLYGKNSTLSTSPQRREGSQTAAMNTSSANNNYQRKQKSLEKGGRAAGKKGK